MRMGVEMEITEDRPMSYTAADGARIELRVAGPERVFTLTVSGERMLTTLNEDYARTVARREAESHDARGGKVPASAPEIDGYEPESIDLDELRAALADTAPAQIVSPLPAAERCASGLATGATLTMPTEPQARALGIAVRWQTPGYPAYVTRSRRCDLRMLRAMARRGWLELDHPIRPTRGFLTDQGLAALARYEAKRGTTGGAR